MDNGLLVAMLLAGLNQAAGYFIGRPPGSIVVRRLVLDAVMDGVIAAYVCRNPSPCLHITLDDGNLEDEHFGHAIAMAERVGCHNCAYTARRWLRLSPRDRSKALGLLWMYQ